MERVALPLEPVPGGPTHQAVGLFLLSDLNALAGLWREAEADRYGFAALLPKYLAGPLVQVEQVRNPALRKALEEAHQRGGLRLMPLEVEALLEEAAANPDLMDSTTLVLGSITPFRGFLGLFFCERWPESRLLAFPERGDLQKALRG
jgi:protein involved in temperature-dependent protein secretion